MRTTILIVRHGETLWNKERRLQGQKDIPLSETGILQAKALQDTIKRHKITKIYTSKLSRAIKTAEIITNHLDLPMKKLKTLNEISYGQWEGKLREEYKEELKRLNIPYHLYTPKNGEPNNRFKKRVISSFRKIVNKNQGETILIVAHGAVIQAIFRHLKKIPYSQDSPYKIPNTCFSIFHLEDGKIIEELLADDSHLAQILTVGVLTKAKKSIE